MIHVSGHPARDELAQMYSWVKPRTLIAVHGETRHINEHVSYAKEHQIKFTLPGRNGSLIQLSPGDPRFIGELEHGRLIVDGNDLITRHSDVLKKRHKMMFNGSVFVVLTINKDFRLINEPIIMAEGLAEIIEGDNPENYIKSFIKEDIQSYYKTKKFDKSYIKESMTNSLKRIIKTQYLKKPIVRLELNFIK
jgi:ribonuclease J